MIIDESGSFDNNLERYMIIGGVFFKENNQKLLENQFVPFHKHLCAVYNCEELHGSENKEFIKMIRPVIGSCPYIDSIIFVIDKDKSFIFDKYNKKSFKYNKAIEHLVQKMLQDELLKEDDELSIKIDNLNLNKNEKRNLKEWLPKNINVVKEVIEEDSKNVICLQFADIIVNSFSKKKICKKSSVEIKLLNPKIYCFLNSTINEYIKE